MGEKINHDIIVEIYELEIINCILCGDSITYTINVKCEVIEIN